MNTLQSILSGNGAEFYTHEDNVMVSYHLRQYNIGDAPKSLLGKLQDYLNENPEKEMAYRSMSSDPISQCVKCMFANLDGQPDITEDGVLIPEFVKCPMRGTCKYEGIGCLNDPFGLSHREAEIADLAEFSNQEIADKLFLSPFTVGTHLQNIQRKMGVRNKKELINTRPTL